MVEPDRLTGIYKNMQQGIVALVLRCSVVRGTPVAADEVDRIRWLEPHELSGMREAYCVRPLDALADGAPRIRAHDGSELVAHPPRRAPNKTGRGRSRDR